MDKIISVIIPVYNVVTFLDECIESIRNQTYNNIEIIIVDDGSTDGSEKKCDLYAKKDKRVVVLHQDNAGLSAARNVGVKYSRGDYVFFCDSDDYIHPQAIEILYKVMVKENAEIAIGSHQKIGEKEFVTFDKINYFERYQIYTGRECVENFYSPEYALDMVVAWNKLYKKETLVKYPYPLNKKHEDEFVTYKILMPLRICVYVSEKLYFYRQRPGSIINQKYNLKSLDKVKALEERKEHFKHNNDMDLYLMTLRRYETALAEAIINVRKFYSQEKSILEQLLNDFNICWEAEIKKSRMPIKDKMKYIIFRIDERLYEVLKKLL